MGVIWKIALRNLREHKVKTLIIGVIISIGITVLVVGNSLMDTAAAGIREAYIDGYTGHVIITGKHTAALSLFGSNSMDETVPLIPAYEKIEEYVASLPEVDAYSPQAVGQATVSVGEEVRGFTMLFGIDPGRYVNTFPDNIELVKGEFLQPGEEGILLSERAVRRMKSDDGKAIEPGDAVLLTGLSLTGGTKIREVQVRGIFRFKHTDPQLNMVSLIDITNLRALFGMNVQSAADIQLDAKEQSLLGGIDEESLFGGEGGLFGGPLVTQAEVVDQKQTEQSLLNILGDTDAPATPSNDSGAWHFLLIKLKSPGQTQRVQAKLEKYFEKEGIEAETQGWMQGAGVMASMSTGIKTVFNIIVLIVAVVAVIIIMNTLVISVTERTAEIGAMRALGAQKSFVRWMITCETIAISAAFGGIGLLSGGLILLVMNATGIQAPNVFFRVLFGGEVLHPVLSLGSVVMSLVVVMVIGVVASLYPASIALKIQPVKAMQGS